MQIEYLIILLGGENRTCKESDLEIKGISVLGRILDPGKNAHLSRSEEFSNKI